MVPVTTLVLVGLLFNITLGINGAMAVGCWGVAWAMVLVVMVIQVRRNTLPQVWGAKPAEDRATWGQEARPFFIYRVSLAVLAQVGVIALDQFYSSAVAVGAYVAAMSTMHMALVLATSPARTTRLHRRA